MRRTKTESKKVWCRHIKWKPFERPWWVFMGYVEADRGWKFCPICAAPLGNRVCLDGTERIVCDKCLGFIARWWIELGEADKRPDKCPVPEQQGKTLMQLCEGGRL